MDIAKLNPWNWFKKEEEQDKGLSARRPASPESRLRRDPLVHLHREIDRLFEHAFDAFPAPWPDVPHLPGIGPERFFRPRVDIAGTEKEYTVTAELPGFAEEDIRIELAGGALSITARREREDKREDKGFYRVERSSGSFRRVLDLPPDIDTGADAEAIKARYVNGVLTVTLPRKPQAVPEARRIPIG